MKTITIPLPDDLHALYLKNEDRVNEALKVAVKNELSAEGLDRMDFVRVICRAKAPVCNWHDMEIQIMKGSL